MSPERRSHWTRRLAAGVPLGALAFAVNLAATWLLLGIEGGRLRWPPGYPDTAHRRLKFAGHVLFNAHFVESQLREEPGPVLFLNFLFDGASPHITLTPIVPASVFLLVPVVALGVAGYHLSRTAPAHSEPGAMATGLTLVPGYLLLAAIGVHWFTFGSGTLRPDPLSAVLLAGVVYPAVCGGLGGVVGYWVHGR